MSGLGGGWRGGGVVVVGGTHYAGNHLQQEACVNADGVPAEASYANVSPPAAQEECRWRGAGNTSREKKEKKDWALQPEEAARRKQTRHVLYPRGAAGPLRPVWGR